MSNWTIILLLVHHPLFDFDQTIVGPFDFVQYLLCLSVSFAHCAVTRTFGSFDVLTNAPSEGIFVRHPHLSSTKDPLAFSSKGLAALEKATLIIHKCRLGFRETPPGRYSRHHHRCAVYQSSASFW